MANRINTKFVILLAAGLFVLGIGAAAIIYFAVLRNPQVYIAKAEKLLAQGELDEAIKQYGRAYGREKNTARKIDLLMKMADLHQQISEQTTTAASHRLGQVLNCWNTVRKYDASHLQATQNLLDIFYTQARAFSSQLGVWNRLYNFCNEALPRLPESSPTAVLLRKFRGISQTMRMDLTDMDEMSRQQALQDLQAALASMTDDADLHYYLALWHIVEAEAQKRMGRDSQVQALRDKGMEIISTYQKARPQDFLANFYLLKIRVSLARATQDEQLQKDNLQLLEQVEKMADPTGDVRLSLELATLLGTLDRETVKLDNGRTIPRGIHRAEALLRKVVQHYPQDLQVLVTLGNLLKTQRRNVEAMRFFEEAHKDRPILINADVSRFRLFQAQATYNLADLCLTQWDNTEDPAEQEKLLARARQYATVLEERLPGDWRGQMIQGKLAVVDGRLVDAVKHFDAASRQLNNRLPEALRLSARSLVQLGQTGAAADRLEQLITNSRNSARPADFYDLARLKLGNNQVEAALRYVEVLVRGVPQFIPGKILKSEILVRQALQYQEDDPQLFEQKLAAVEKLLDEIDQPDNRNIVFQRARIAQLRKQDDKAYALLKQYYDDHPDDMLTLQQLVRIMVSMGRKEQAQAMLNQLSAQQPDNEVLTAMSHALAGETEQSADRIKQVIENEKDPLLRQIKLYAYYRQTGDQDKAEQHFKKALALDPEQNNEMLLRERFRRAVLAKNWDQAQKIVDHVSQMNGGNGLDSAGGMFWQGRLQMARGDYRQALQSFDSALKQVPFSSEGWMLLGDARRQLDDDIGAEQAYRRAVELKPNDPNLLERLFRIESARGEHDKALKTLETLVRNRRGDRRIYRLYLAYLGEYGNKQKALALRQRLAQTSPDDTENQRAIAQLYLDLNQPEKARQVLEPLLAKEPDSLANRMAMALYHYVAGNPDAGQALMKQYIEQRGDKATMEDWVQYARYLRRTNQTGLAEAAYRKAITLEKPPVLPASRELADWLFGRRQFEQAATYYKAVLAATDTHDGRVWRRYIDTLINAGQFEQAQAQVDQLIQAEPGADKDFQVVLLQARIAEEQKRKADADRLYDLAVKLAPNNPVVYIQRARFRFSDETMRPQVADDLNKAIELAPSLIPPREMLISWHRWRQDLASAIQELERLVEVAPQYIPARIQLAGYYLQRRQLNKLDSLLADCEQRFPGLTAWSQLRARLSAMQNRPQDAIKHLAEVYEKNKTPANAYALIQAQLVAGQVDQADQLLRQYPRQVAEDPIFQAVKARILHLRGRTDDARRSFGLALKLAGNDPAKVTGVLNNMYLTFNITEQEQMLQAYLDQDPTGLVGLALYQIWLSQREPAKLERAIEGLRGLSQRKPDDLVILQTLALACHHAKRYEEAAQCYLKLHEKRPDDLSTLNNLAYLYADNLDRPADAIPLARRALEIVGNNINQRANVLDTLGWVLFRAGQNVQAVSYLRQSIQTQELPANRLHLGQVYLAQGQVDKAREELMIARKIAERNKDKLALQQIDQVLKTLAEQQPADAAASAGVREVAP